MCGRARPFILLRVSISPFRYLRSLRDDRRTYGWRGMLKRHGWRPLALFVAFYLIRDLVLYVLIPLAVIAGFRQ
jgi:hypothetical protein